MNKILLFAGLQEKAGQAEVELNAVNKSIAEIKSMLKESYQMEEIDTSMAAVNEEYANGDFVVKEGDTIAFIPPVSGG
ncbi:molybdopterin synthase sulfur carrier subunit [Thalassobacillus cyri]|uniref:Molybdopterin synthase sulfur carrier subunit n=1 Tax=Thalassobacillus cyri TaxID=571932 RepID=A0A1H3VIC0_9BACI|nr:molybdopterin converting factor subunit 1 [Thalassobacillus cyri]SDZ74543.1 molybdopterin synthase sulfur carrier subunit [Thalassobacillus cyri]